MATETLTALPRVRVSRLRRPLNPRRPWLAYCTDCRRGCALTATYREAYDAAQRHVEEHRQAAAEPTC